MRVIDGDGHVIEDRVGLMRHVPPEFRKGLEHMAASPAPPLDHLHSQPMVIRGAERGEVALEEWIAFLEEVGIEQSVLYPTQGLAIGKISNYDWSVVYCRSYNDWLHDTYLSKSSRFRGIGLIPMQDPGAAIEELRHAVVDLGMCGAMLPTNGLPVSLGSKLYWPVYEEANRLGCCLSVHGGSHDRKGMDHFNIYAGVHALGHPFGQMIAATDLLLNGVLHRYPNVRFGFLEGGVAWLDVLVERLPRSYDTHRNIDTRGEALSLGGDESITEELLQLMRAGRIFVGCEGEEPGLPRAVAEFGPAFFFSSDFPHEVTAASCRHELHELISSSDTSDDEKAEILSGAAQRYYCL